MSHPWPVALNFQTNCTDMDVNQGRFLVNGKSGYILKPAYMRRANTTFDPVSPAPGEWLAFKKLHVMVECSAPAAASCTPHPGGCVLV